MINKIILPVLLLVVLISCDKDDDVANEPSIDFVYSTAYVSDSLYFEVCASSACNYVPAKSEFRWYFNGSINEGTTSFGLSACDYFRNNGSFSLSLVVTTPDGMQYSKAVNFEVDGIVNK